MDSEKKTDAAGLESRRKFMKSTAKVAMTAPVVAMLLTSKPTMAHAYAPVSIDDAGSENDICGVPIPGGADQTNCP